MRFLVYAVDTYVDIDRDFVILCGLSLSDTSADGILNVVMVDSASCDKNGMIARYILIEVIGISYVEVETDGVLLRSVE